MNTCLVVFCRTVMHCQQLAKPWGLVFWTRFDKISGASMISKQNTQLRLEVQIEQQFQTSSRIPSSNKMIDIGKFGQLLMI